MSEYLVKSEYTGEPWAVKNVTRDHEFFAGESDGRGGQDAGPNPVEYLAGAVNSCIAISEAMIVDHNSLDVSNFKVETRAFSRDLGHGKSDVNAMRIRVSFDSNMTGEEQQKFLDHVLQVSTVYQTLAKNVEMEVKIF